MIDEHQARPGTANQDDLGAVPEMDENEKRAVKLVMHLWDKAKRHRAKYDRNWLDYYKFFRGDQWLTPRPSYRHSEVLNFVFQTIQSMIPIMTDGRPMPNFVPRDPSDMEFSKVLSEVFEAEWQSENWLFKETEVLYDGHIYGTGISHLRFDEDAQYGLGGIRYDSFEPLEYYPDPDANFINGCEFDSQYTVTACPVDTEKLRLKWKGHKFAAAIKPDLTDPTLKTKTSFDKDAFKRVRHTNVDLSTETMGGTAQDRADKTLVITCYMKPADTEEVEKPGRDEDGNESVQYITKKMYPQGRKLVIINGRPFSDGPLDNDDKKFPFSKYVNYILPREFYGISEVEQLKSPQMIFNKLVSFTLDVLTFAGNPVWLIPTSSGVDPESFHNAPGLQLPYAGDNPPRIAEGAQLQPFVMQLIDRMEKWFNGISGSQDVTRGVNPAGVTAASAIENLQDAAQTRIRQKMRNMDAYLVSVGEQWVQLALQHYTVPRVFRLTNQEGAEKYFKFHVEPSINPETGKQEIDEKGDPVRIGVKTEFKMNDLGRMVPDELSTKKHVIRGAFDVKVNTGSGLPFKKAEKERRLLELFQLNIIDRRTVLEELEFPNMEEVLQRVEEADAAAAQAQGAV
jgi:hypothetical protein